MPIVDLLSSIAAPSTVAAGDPESSRLVYAMVIGLVLVGIGLLAVAVWVLRQTRPDLEVLAPLERMGDSDWNKRDPSTQRRMLDEVRPEGAEPLSAEPPPPPIDAEFEQTDHPVTSFSDLGPGVGGGVDDPISVTDPEDTADESVDGADESVDGADESVDDVDVSVDDADVPDDEAADDSVDDADVPDDEPADAPDGASGHEGADGVVDEPVDATDEPANEPADDRLSDPRGRLLD